MKLWQLTFLEKRTETTYDAESTNKFSDELNKELTDETGCFNFFNLRTKIWWASIRFRGFCDYSTRQGDSTNFWSNKGIKDVINRKVRGSTRDCFDKYSRCSWMTCTYRVGWWCNQGWKHVLEGLPGSLSKWKVYAGGQRDLLCL